MTQADRFLAEIWRALDGDPSHFPALPPGDSLPACFAVSDLAHAAIAAAAHAAAAYAGLPPDAVQVDRRLASLWFGWSFQPIGWARPAIRDDLTGDYQAADAWLRIQANAPHHRAAALRVLGPALGGDPAAALPRRTAAEWETAIVAAGGCAAEMRPMAAWATHPQGQAVASEPLVWLHSTDCPPSAPPSNPARPLAGLRVLDLTRVFAGPVCTRILAGLGADVLRLDPPHWDEPGVVPEMTLGKRCARLDARTEDGRARLAHLLAHADILVHGYRPGALDSIGLGERRRLRPDLIDVSLDAWGWTGPWSGRRGFDSLVQMASGIADEGMRRFGTDRPKPLPVQALDHTAGYVMAAACLRALAERQAGRAWTARTSLARIAALLAPTASDPEGTLAAPTQADFAETIELTTWGPMRRLRSPWTLAGAPLRWDRPASPLGTAEPSFLP